MPHDQATIPIALYLLLRGLWGKGVQIKKRKNNRFPAFIKKKISESKRTPYLFFLEAFFFATLTFFFEADFFTATSAPPFPMK
jgi:hypothetical protein